jgi:hypothetical protein
MKNKIFGIVSAAAALLLGSAAPLSAQLQPASVEVLSVSGGVNIIDETGVDSKPQVGQLFKEGSQISTPAKGRLKLAFANGTRVVVEPDSEVRLVSFKASNEAGAPTSGFGKLSTIKEPGNSSVEVWLTRGTLLFEVPVLNLPVSSFKVTSPYLDAYVRPSNAPAIFKFEQGDDYGRLSVYKGVVRAAPRFKEFGTPVDVTNGNFVLYRFNKNMVYEGIQDAVNAGNAVAASLRDPNPGDIPGWEDAPTATNPLDVLAALENVNKIDTSLIGVASVAPAGLDPHLAASGNSDAEGDD